MPLLHPGDTFPELSLTAPGGEIMTIPEGSCRWTFVLDPRGTVLVSVYSSGAIGRLVPEDVAGLVSYVRERASRTVDTGRIPAGGSGEATVRSG